MLPTRFVPGQAPRKSRLGDRQSFLPRRVGSTDWLSDSRPSGAGLRSSSADAGRSAGGRLSREASASKLPMNRRSRSQQGDSGRGQSFTTPLRNNQYLRPTTTPVRTPSGDRSRGWEASLDRALACVTVKDQRPIANTAWQRATLARVQESLAARGDGGAALIRPLTIARFVDIAGSLLHAITGDDKLNNDNYVTKLPHMCKRLLYPGTVSKSWLKTVNTLHAFPQALALVAYLLDLLQRIDSPVVDEWVYLDSDELSRLRRDYLRECFDRFQTLDADYSDLNEEYLRRLKQLLDADDDKIRQLEDAVQEHEKALSEELESTAAERASEASRAARRDALAAAVRAARLNIANTRAALDQERARARDRAAELDAVDADIGRATAEMTQLRRELETQTMTKEERARLLDDVDYATRVYDSKRLLAEQVSKMVHSKETELALWQKKTLDSCVQYKQALIHLSAQFPELAAAAMDETQLMEPECAAAAAAALDGLRRLSARLTQRRAALARARSAHATQRHAEMEENRAAIADIKCKTQQALQARDDDVAAEATEEREATLALDAAAARLAALRADMDECARAHDELAFWRKQDESWRAKLAEAREYIRAQREREPELLRAAGAARAQLVAAQLAHWNRAADSVL